MKNKVFVDKFLAWRLPQTVCSDMCVTDNTYPHRLGTNLLTAEEAEQMIGYLFGDAFTLIEECEKALEYYEDKAFDQEVANDLPAEDLRAKIKEFCEGK